MSLIPSTSPSTVRRLDVLDALRAIAVMGVLAVHFPGLWIGNYIDTGTLGVRLFFALSGFLITGLLLRDRELIDNGHITLGTALKSFYIRRLFRILPAYYATLALAWGLAIEDIQVSWPWHAAFLSNIHTIRLGYWPGMLSHLWTLAMEFQFYLVWPFCIVALPRRMLPLLLILCMIIGVMARHFSPSWGVPAGFEHLTTLGSIDMFAAGAAVSWSRSLGARSMQVDIFCKRWLPYALALSLAASAHVAWPLPHALGSSSSGIAMAVGFSMLICCATMPEPPRWSHWLAARKGLVRIGVVSYGVYLYHNLMHWVAPRACLRLFGDPYPDSVLLYTSVLLAATALISAGSWYLLEEPINRWALRFRIVTS